MGADEFFMAAALAEAKTALDEGEFPVGCVLVAGGRIVAKGRRYNSAGGAANELDHAEITALRALAPWGAQRGIVAYTTMEPCLMCLGALLLAGARRIVYAVQDVMGGAASLDRSTLAPLYRDSPMEIIPDVLRDEALALFGAFFLDPHNRYWHDSLLARHILGQISLPSV